MLSAGTSATIGVGVVGPPHVHVYGLALGWCLYPAQFANAVPGRHMASPRLLGVRAALWLSLHPQHKWLIV